MSVFIIGDGGACHEETLTRALQLGRAGVAAGVDAIAFPYWSSHERMSQRRKVVASGAYQLGSVRLEWLQVLHQTARDAGKLLLLDVALPEDVEMVQEHCDGFVVGPLEAQDHLLLAAVECVRGDRPWFVINGPRPADTWIPLHGVLGDPCPTSEANLAAIDPPNEGYADYTHCVFTAAFAVAAGASALWLPFRLEDSNPNGEDWAVSLSPRELAYAVSLARQADAMRGHGRREPNDREREFLLHQVTTDP